MQEITFQYKVDKTKLNDSDYSIVEDLVVGLTLNLALALNLNYSYNVSDLAKKLKIKTKDILEDSKDNDDVIITLDFATSLELSILKMSSILAHADSSTIRQLLQPYKRYLVNKEHINNETRLSKYTKMKINGKSIYRQDNDVPAKAVISIELLNLN